MADHPSIQRIFSSPSYDFCMPRIPKAKHAYREIAPNELVGMADIVADAKRGIQLRITTDTLIGGLWWQLAQKLSGETNIQRCRYCSAPFETGPGTGRHVDAAFCSNEHKVRFFSLARSKRHKGN